MTPRPAPTTTLAIALLAASATAPLRNVFDGWQWAIGVGGAALVAALLASAVETLRPRVPLAVITLTTAMGAGAWTLAVTLRGSFWRDPVSRRVWQDLADGVFGGWSALLDERLPPNDPQSAEIFVTVLVWTVATAAVHIAARNRTALGAIGGAATILAVSTAAALPRGLSPAVLGGAAGAVALFAIATITRAPDQGWRARRIAALAALIGSAGLVATGAGLAIGTRDSSPVDPRSSREVETLTIEVPDVLAEYGVRRSAEQTVLTIASETPPAGLRLRLQVYDDHDGERWLPATAFEELTEFPPVTAVPPGDVVDLEVQFDELDGPWIPLPDRVISVDAREVRWNAQTQTMITDRRPDGYRVSGTLVPRTDLEGVERARDDAAADRSRAPSGLPDPIRELAEEVTAEAADAVSAVDAITARLRTLGRDESTPPGNSFARLRDDLAAGEPTGAEQIASLHALMLRSVGIPSRLVVGYVADGPLVRSDDLHIWVEVAFADIGWVAFDPVPASLDTGRDATEDPVVSTTTQPSRPPLQARALPTELGPGQDPGEDAIDLGGRFGRRELALVTLLATGGLVLLLIAVRVARRALRNSGRRGHDVRVLGAWAEVVDRLRELGAPISRASTTGDVVELASSIDDTVAGHTATVAELATRALHAPEESSADDAARAWSELRHTEARIAEVRGRRSVPRRFLDPRVLRHRAPRPPASRRSGRRAEVS